MIPHCTDEVYWYGYDLTFDKAYKKCINAIERIIRASLEYDLWAKDCKQNDPNAIRCPICHDNYYEKNSKCDTHHHPRTLYCIVDDVITDMIDNNAMKTTTCNDVVKTVLEMHLRREVSYINICTHCHKKYHDGNPDVSTAMYNYFENKVAEHKNSISQIGNERPILSSSNQAENIMKPPLIAPPLLPSIDNGAEHKLTKFKSS